LKDVPGASGPEGIPSGPYSTHQRR
jgi:hypothetical protein